MKAWLVSLAVSMVMMAPTAGLVWQGRHNEDRKAWNAIYRYLPARGKEKPFYLRQVPEDEWQIVTDLFGSGLAGFYVGGAGRAYVRDLGGPLEERVFVHEFGHHVWHGLSDAEQADWLAFWTEHRERMPSEYAKYKHTEGWAEVYEYLYYRDPDPVSPVDPAVKAKMESYFDIKAAGAQRDRGHDRRGMHFICRGGDRE